MRTLILSMTCLSVGLFFLTAGADEDTSASVQTGERVPADTIQPTDWKIDFEGKMDPWAHGWIGITDTIMGGKSSVTVTIDTTNPGTGKQSLKITGSVIAGTNPFIMFAGAATRFYTDKQMLFDVSELTGIKFLTKGDGNTYRIELPCAEVTDYMFHSFAFSPPTDEWREYRVPFKGFKQMPYGKKVTWTGTDVQGIHFMTVGGPIERFTLYVDEIEFYK